MPDSVRSSTTDTAYFWAGLSAQIWGNVKWGDSTSGTFTWDFGDGTPIESGTVSDNKDISVDHTYAAGGTTYYATLTVIDDNGMSDSDIVRIDVLTASDKAAEINRSIETGLKWLYKDQWSDGRWHQNAAYYATSTALSLLAFENRGHLVTNDPDEDIYVYTLQSGFAALCTFLEFSNDITTQPAGDPDTHGTQTTAFPDGRMVSLPYSGRSNYEHGIVMLAFAGAGTYKKGSDPYDAITNPGLNYMGTINLPEGGTIDLCFYDILAGMVDYVAWAQTEDGGRGSWRYSGNNSGGDQSVSQWPAIGCEAAENWGLLAAGFVKEELLNYWLVDSYGGGGQWGYDGNDGNYNVTHAGAAICQLSWCGVPKTDPRIVDTLSWLDANWDGNWGWYPWNLHMQGGFYSNFYGMYAVAKGCRIARDSMGNVSEINSIGSRDWYSIYSSYIMSEQYADSHWDWTMGYYHDPNLNTPICILILEPTISSQRPQAVITASPNPTPPLQAVSFDISGSYHQDPGKYLVSWQLDWNNDGIWDASGAFPQGTPVINTAGYPDTGSDYTVNALLKVTDNIGETDNGVVTVSVSTLNVPPVANPGGPYNGTVGSSITLNGSASYDPNAVPPINDHIVSWEWDINGDGVYGDLTGEIVSYSWGSPYVGVIGLKVTDTFGASSISTSQAKVTITDLWPKSYKVVSQKRIGGPGSKVWEYTMSFTMENKGNGDASNVNATLNNWPSNIAVIDGSASWSSIPGYATVTAADTFKLRIDRSVATSKYNLTWIVQYDDAGGSHQTLVNFPFLP
jgi:hypothetical protein